MGNPVDDFEDELKVFTCYGTSITWSYLFFVWREKEHEKTKKSGSQRKEYDNKNSSDI